MPRQRQNFKRKEAGKSTAVKQTEIMEKASEKEISLANWIPKTELGKKVQAGEITSMEEIFDKNLAILEPQIVDYLLELEEKIFDIQKTTRVTRAGRKFSFRAAVLVGNKNGFVGIGVAKDAEKWPATKKAKKRARLNIIRIRRGCGSWECTCGLQHTVPFKVTGKSASVRVTLLPAPKGTGLVVGDKIKDVLNFAGITDVWSNCSGSTDTTLNFVRATINALSKTTKMKVSNEISKKEEKKR